jgi:hypothetical protein
VESPGFGGLDVTERENSESENGNGSENRNGNENRNESRTAIDRRTLLKGVTAASLLGGVPLQVSAGESAASQSEQPAIDSDPRAQERPRFQYSVKFVCGEAEGERFARGRYRTAINVHNPIRDGETRFRWRVAPAFRAEPTDPSEFDAFGLGPDEALEIGCEQIRDLADLGGPGDLLTGFVVVEAETELDVVAVYTADADGVRSMDVERIPPRRLGNGGGGEEGGGDGNRPDLVPEEVACGHRSVEVTVRNRGNAPAGPSQTAVDFGRYGNQMRTTPVLAPGQSVTRTFQIPTRPDNCYDPNCEFTVTVDATDAVNESNETNNSVEARCRG